MAVESLEQKVVRYVKDAHAMEQNVRRMLDSMIATTSDEEIRKHLEHHKEETQRHEQRLQQRLQEMGEDTSSMRDIPAVLGAMVKAVGDQVRIDKPGKNARDGFVTENMEIASYELLERLARRAGDEQTAQLASEIREEEEAMARFFASNWDRFIELTVEEAQQ